MSDNYLLFVEGPDDKHVVYHLLKHYDLSEQLKIEPKGGLENLLATLPAELRLNDELERLGIMIDADLDLNARWMALKSSLKKVSSATSLPNTPDPKGTIITLEQPHRTLIVGVWIMPDNNLPGMLEDFVSFLAPADDTLWQRATDCIRQIPEQDRLFPPQHQIKAHLHTWLAWQEEPGKPMGQAITKRFLDPNALHAQQLIA